MYFLKIISFSKIIKTILFLQMMHSCAVIASNLLLVDEIMRAGLSSLKGGS